MDDLASRVTIDPAICNGKPTLRGKRITVQTILEFCIAFAARLMGHGYVIFEPPRTCHVAADLRVGRFFFDDGPKSARLYCPDDEGSYLMSPLLKVERQIQELSPEELAQFRAWFAEFEAALWDRQIEEDARAGRLDHLADAALVAHARGETTEL